MNELPAYVKMAILGYGPNEALYKKIIKENKLEKRVKILPAVPYTELISYMSSADIGVIPTVANSTSTRLSLPNKFFEYSMSGLVVATSDLPVLRMMAEKYKEGGLFDPQKPESIAKTISELIKNKDKFKVYQNNLKKVAKELNWDNEKKKYLKAYKDLVNAKN
jgi:glycosyltransferase involved in cell wall biosynthesis